MKKCNLCNTDIDNVNSHWLSIYNIWLCNQCYSENVIKCDDCGAEIFADDGISIDILPEDIEHKIVCKQCFDKNYTTCKICGKTTNKYETIWDNGYVCKECQQI